jgi:hypothetical protein
MSIEPLEAVINKIITQYNRNTTGWMVLSDNKGNVLVIGPETGYKLKLISLNPQDNMGVGVEINDVEQMRKNMKVWPSYGLRPLSSFDANTLLNTFDSVTRNKLITNLLGIKPVPTLELQKREAQVVLSGPIITHPNLSTISKSQRALDVKLALEADNLFRKKYPHRAAIYG